jgi:hypothetical protein
VCMDKKEWKDTRYSKCNVLLCPATCFWMYHSLQDQ